MTSREAFGPNLRRMRLQNGISIEELSSRTKVSTELWEAMEQNDFSRWPTGVAARAYVRDYATIVGADPNETIAEFCRVIPNGDRRAEPLLRKTSELLRHELTWQDDISPDLPDGDRRASAATADDASPRWWNPRAIAAGMDIVAIAILAFGTSATLGLQFGTTLAVISLTYYAISMAAFGCSPGAWATDFYLSVLASAHPADRLTIFRRLSLLRTEHPRPERHASE